MLRDSQEQGNGTPRLIQEAMLVSRPAEAQQIHIQSLSPKNKGGLLYIYH
jgi:hypothetical protein